MPTKEYREAREARDPGYKQRLSREHDVYYRANKTVRDAAIKARRDDHTAWLAEQKSQPCLDCGVSYPPYVMDWHHRDPSTKVASIGRMRLYSKDRLIEEIAKCDLLCSNCHRIREYGDG